MKRTLLLTVLSAVLLFPRESRAQVPVVNKILPKVMIGIKAGANFESLSGASWNNAMKAGFNGGAFVGVTKGKIGVQGEVLLSTVKYDVSLSGGSSVQSMYLNIPVLLEYKLVSRLWIQVGPQFNSMLSAKQGGTDVKKAFNTSDIAGVAGLQVILPMHFVVSARYILGFSDVRNTSYAGSPSSEHWKTNAIQLSLGFRFL